MNSLKKFGILTVVLITPALINFTFSNSSTNIEDEQNLINDNSTFVQSKSETSIFKLWEDDMTLSQNAVLCFSENDIYAEESITLLCQNKAALNLTIQSSYGKNARKEFAALLETRILLTFDLAIALKNQDAKTITTSTNILSENSEEISQLIEISETNNRLSEMEVEFNDHSNQLNSAIVAYIEPTTTKIKESKPIVIAAEKSEEEIAKSLPKKFEGGSIKSMFK